MSLRRSRTSQHLQGGAICAVKQTYQQARAEIPRSRCRLLQAIAAGPAQGLPPAATGHSMQSRKASLRGRCEAAAPGLPPGPSQQPHSMTAALRAPVTRRLSQSAIRRGAPGLLGKPGRLQNWCRAAEACLTRMTQPRVRSSAISKCPMLTAKASAMLRSCPWELASNGERSDTKVSPSHHAVESMKIPALTRLAAERLRLPHMCRPGRVPCSIRRRSRGGGAISGSHQHR